ncbi:uncharacterized protein LOC132728128 [Ruditapes philippinarum]|uniref:uncharacterized protein LOC132728128 n=1 Tax=Ruditapes philippinarum TaxID=129788 RepID=UPI00295C007B|nr:uncharacterized protein LOC132728128 [Ruditapes philippinarum]
MNVLTCFVLVLSSAAGRKIVDLTHTFDGDAPKYPLGFLSSDLASFVYFNMTTLTAQYYDDMWLALRKIEFYEHQGTHIDAPLHFGNGRQSLEQIPPERLYGPGVVIDVRDKVKVNPDYAVTVDDIFEHEREHGKIPPNAIVNMNSGWANKYPDARLVFGTDNVTDPSSFHFPGWSPEACEMLLQKRQINVLGVDTPSTDPAQPPVYPCHMYLQPNNVPLMEYVANLDSIPVRNTTIVLGAMKVRDGTGGPTRVPVSILNVVSKILEKVVYDQVETYFKEYKLLYKFQSGLRNGFSTDNCLIYMTDYIRHEIDKGNVVGMALLDLQKAFDTVDHTIFLMKLQTSGLGDDIIRWFRSYFSERQQLVDVSGSFSSTSSITCGVPPGFNPWAPPLFNDVNDMSAVVKNRLLLYADDSGIHVSGKSLSEVEISVSEDLSSVSQWLIDDKLSLHLGKTESIVFGSKQKLWSDSK